MAACDDGRGLSAAVPVGAGRVGCGFVGVGPADAGRVAWGSGVVGRVIEEHARTPVGWMRAAVERPRWLDGRGRRLTGPDPSVADRDAAAA